MAIPSDPDSPIGKGLSAAAWLARKLLDGSGSPDAAKPGDRPARPRPATPDNIVSLPIRDTPEIAESLTRARLLREQIGSEPSPGDVVALTAQLAAEIDKLCRPGERFTACVLRTLRALDTESRRSHPRGDVVRRVGDEVWSGLFFSGPMQPAPWTQTRTTELITSEQLGTDEMLLRAAVAHQVVRPDVPNPFASALELWRCGVVPDVTPTGVISRSNGAVVAESGPSSGGRGVA